MIKRVFNWRLWGIGLMGAAIGATANTICVMVVAPETFNFGDGLGKLAEVAFVAALVGAAQYLKQHPVPEETEIPL